MHVYLKYFTQTHTHSHVSLYQKPESLELQPANGPIPSNLRCFFWGQPRSPPEPLLKKWPGWASDSATGTFWVPARCQTAVFFWSFSDTVILFGINSIQFSSIQISDLFISFDFNISLEWAAPAWIQTPQDGPTVRLEEGSGPAKGWDPWIVRIVCRCPMLDDPKVDPKSSGTSPTRHIISNTSQ